ncbi:MAG: hypothetical protein M0P39_14525 [Rhodocyclaceae bacterium]|nr:hypothetical protein [Rhodocyclaceae bacterium]
MFKSLVFVAGTSLVLGGCASHSHSIAEGAASGFLKGELVHLQPSRLILESEERKYVAEGFEVQRHQNRAELRKRYRMSDPKHWDRIASGLDKDHESYSAVANPKAQDGSELTCRLAWRAVQTPQGTCQDNSGKEYVLKFD